MQQPSRETFKESKILIKVATEKSIFSLQSDLIEFGFFKIKTHWNKKKVYSKRKSRCAKSKFKIKKEVKFLLINTECWIFKTKTTCTCFCIIMYREHYTEYVRIKIRKDTN
jgi:hypothetical protein